MQIFTLLPPSTLRVTHVRKCTRPTAAQKRNSHVGLGTRLSIRYFLLLCSPLPYVPPSSPLLSPPPLPLPPPPRTQVSAIDQLAIHFTLDSNLLHKESDEALRQLAQGEGGCGLVGGACNWVLIAQILSYPKCTSLCTCMCMSTWLGRDGVPFPGSPPKLEHSFSNMGESSLVPRLHSPAFLAHVARNAGEWSLGTRLGESACTCMFWKHSYSGK